MIHPNPYATLMRGTSPSACNAFDAHVLASVLAIASVESDGDGLAFLAGIGLDRASLLELVWHVFPDVHGSLAAAIPDDATVTAGENEIYLRDLLARNTSDGSALELCLATMIARRCQRPNHLWQDLGLRGRRELSWLMERHFAPLAVRNTKDMKWKKFLYRAICRDDGPLLCVAPSCAECEDRQRCFGDEQGESLLGHPPDSNPTQALRETPC